MLYCEFSNKKVTMIELFACKETRKIWNRQFSKKLPSEIQQQAFEKMRRLNRATVLNDFLFPPSNHFESLKGERQGQYSVRVNQQWRLCFEFNGHVQNLELVDYH